MQQLAELMAQAAPAAGVQRSPLERMPKWLICVPLVMQWLWLSVRWHSTTLPSSANPAITSGGLVGETKLEYFRAMGPAALSATARHCGVTPALRRDMAAVLAGMAAAGFTFPVVAKPDLGMCGFGVRRIDNPAALAAYFGVFPAHQDIVLQEYLAQEGEAGIFYAREPGQPHGRIIGLALRYFPRVTGDGCSTLAELVAADPRAQRAQGRADHDLHIDGPRVPARGEVVRLSTIGSTRVGGLYRDGGAHITPELTCAIDAIARDMDRFHAGRFDVRFDDVQALREGRGLKIMEINGAGSEAIHAWDPDIGLLRAFRIIFAKQRLLFAIGAANRKLGYKPISLWQLARLHVMQQKLLDQYPPSN